MTAQPNQSISKPLKSPIQVCREVFNGFYAWEQRESEAILSSLSRPAVSKIRPPNGNTPSIKISTEQCSGGAQFLFEDSALASDRVPAPWFSTPSLSDWDNRRPFLQHPRYITCTPLSLNTQDALVESDELVTAFVPFADDEMFNALKFLNKFNRLIRWQEDFEDPNWEVIRLEASQRLSAQHENSTWQIQAFPPAFPLFVDQLCHLNNGDGVGKNGGTLSGVSSRRRDFVTWPEVKRSTRPASAPVSGDFCDSESVGSSLYERTQALSRRFCRNLNCVTFYAGGCKLHKIPQIQEGNTKVPSTNLYTKSACGGRCFLHVDKDQRTLEGMEPLIWKKGHPAMSLLRSLLKVESDSLPCDLAILTRAPCNEVFANRLSMYRDNSNAEGRANTSKVKLKKKWAWFKDVGEGDTWAALPPCSHPGRCTSKQCSCFDARHHCSRYCCCDSQCSIKWKGCRCGARSKSSTTQAKDTSSCGGKRCPCRKCSRECDPKECTTCDCNGNRCSNKRVQRQTYPSILIKKTEFGQGAFATTRLAKETILGEYVGEIDAYDSLKAHEADQFIRRHTGLNYAFALEPDYVLDSRFAGNETRYLNHSETGPNCSASVLVVNDTQKIILTTDQDIESAQELLLDYGDKYWNQQSDGEEEEEHSVDHV